MQEGSRFWGASTAFRVRAYLKKRLFWALLGYNRRRSKSNSRARPVAASMLAEHSRAQKILSPAAERLLCRSESCREAPRRGDAKKVLGALCHLTVYRPIFWAPVQAQNATQELNSAAADTTLPTARPSVPKLSSARV